MSDALEIPDGIDACIICKGSAVCPYCRGTGAADLRTVIPDEEWATILVDNADRLCRVISYLNDDGRILPTARAALTELRIALEAASL